MLFKFHRNFLEGFEVGLKTFFGLAVPNQYCQVVMKEIEAGFRVIFVAGKAQFCMIPTKTVLPYCMIKVVKQGSSPIPADLLVDN